MTKLVLRFFMQRTCGAFDMKIDGVPGRLNMGYLLILHEDLFYGQCSEFCGRDHYRMSIVVKGTCMMNSFI